MYEILPKLCETTCVKTFTRDIFVVNVWGMGFLRYQQDYITLGIM